MKDQDVIMLAFIIVDVTAGLAFTILNIKLNSIIKKLDHK